MFGVCFLWGRTPLLPWSYRILVPLMAAAFVVLGAFPAGTFPRDASVVALYVFYIVLALLGCAVLLAVVRNRELPANVASGFACGVAAHAVGHRIQRRIDGEAVFVVVAYQTDVGTRAV